MENQNQLPAQRQGRALAQTSSLTNYELRLATTDEENKIIQLRGAATRIGQFNGQESKLWAKVLLMKIHVITGWVIPEDDFLLTILKDQFEKKLLEDYEVLNVEEIEYAFRSCGTNTQDWGKAMNLGLLDSVLQRYMAKRMEALRAVLHNGKDEQRIYTDEEILNGRRGDIEAAYQCMRKGKIPIVHEYFSEVLVQDGFILNREDIHEFFVKQLNNQVEKLYECQPQ